MNLFRLGLVLALLASLLGIAIANDGYGDGVKVCNCAVGASGGWNVPHSASVNVLVDIGQGQQDNAGPQNTGQTGNAQTNVTIPGRSCVHVHYHFNCTKSGTAWLCTLLSFTIPDPTPVQPGDCP